MEGMDEEDVISRIMDNLVKSDPSKAYVRVQSYLGLVSVYLKKLKDVKIRKRDPLELVVKYETNCPDEMGGGKTFKEISIYMLKDQFDKLAWIRIRTKLFKIDDIDSQKVVDALKRLLNANYLFTEFAFDIDEKGWIGVTEDIYIPALTYDVFLEEFLSIIQAIEYFINDFAKEFNVKIKCYKEKDWETT